jgi:hypothetical protein
MYIAIDIVKQLKCQAQIYSKIKCIFRNYPFRWSHGLTVADYVVEKLNEACLSE